LFAKKQIKNASIKCHKRPTMCNFQPRLSEQCKTIQRILAEKFQQQPLSFGDHAIGYREYYRFAKQS